MIRGLVELRKYLGESEINVNDCQFKVLTEDEINDEFYNFQVELFDEIGLNSLTDSCFNYVLDNFVETQYFKDLHFDIIYERQEYYDDSEIEELCRIYEEENVEKMLEIDLQEQLNSVDSVEFCRDWMGDEEFCRIVEENGKYYNSYETILHSIIFRLPSDEASVKSPSAWEFHPFYVHLAEAKP